MIDRNVVETERHMREQEGLSEEESARRWEAYEVLRSALATIAATCDGEDFPKIFSPRNACKSAVKIARKALKETDGKED